jgi:hypothetical protein
MALAAWARAAGGGVTLVARWHPRVTTESTGSSGACGRGRGDDVSFPLRLYSAQRGQGMGGRRWYGLGDGLGRGWARRGAGMHGTNSEFDFV